MKTYKLIDFYGSLVLIVSCLIYGLIKANEYALLGYFIVGGWQLVSMLVHQLNGWFVAAGSNRRRYHLLVFWCLIIAAIGMVIYVLLLLELFILLFVAPVMAIYYSTLCYQELKMMGSRPLAQLK